MDTEKITSNACLLEHDISRESFEKLKERWEKLKKREVHARLIRTRTEILGGEFCDYWYVGDWSPALEAYSGLPKI